MAMQPLVMLLLALLTVAASTAAAHAQGQSLYSKVASCVAQEVKKEAIKAVASAVGIAQVDGSDIPQAISAIAGEFYTVGFTPGLGCFLTSVITKTYPPAPDAPAGMPAMKTYTPGAIIAISPLVSRVNADKFTCQFTNNSSAYTSAQVKNLMQLGPSGSDKFNYSAALYQFPSDLTSLRRKVRCAYIMYARSGFYYTDQTCGPSEDPNSPPNCTKVAFDLPSVQWQFDKDNQPAASQFTKDKMSVTCKVNKALLGRWDTALGVVLPNDGACFPASARVVTRTGPKPLAELAIGDSVLAVDATGQAVFDEVYLMPHRDAEATTTYLNIHASPVSAKGGNKVLTVSPTHYVPTACGSDKKQQCLKHAREVAVGDLVWLLEGQHTVLAHVTEVTASTEQGMFSPWTLSSSIVVEGFAASTHTAWPYETQLLQLLLRKHAITAQHLLAQAHHAVQAPLRVAYRALGKSPLAVLDRVIYEIMEATKDSAGGLAVAVRAAATATSKGA